MIEGGATHIGVATDHVIESFRNELWPGYKTGEGIEPALLAQFHPLEEALAAMGVAVWPMIELEADDALASAARTRGGRRARREGLHLDARQGSRAVRARRSRRADRSPREDDPRCGRRAREVRRRAGADPRLPRAGRRRGRRLSRASRASASRAPRGSSIATARSRTFRRRCSASSASSRCCSRSSRRCAPTRRCSPTSTSCAGAARREAFAAMSERLGDARVLARSRKAPTT